MRTRTKRQHEASDADRFEPFAISDGDYLTPACAGSVIGYSASAMSKAIDDGELPVVRLRTGCGGIRSTWVVSVRDLRAFRDSRIRQYEGARSDAHRERLRALRETVGKLGDGDRPTKNRR